MLQLEQGDTSKAIAGLSEVARELPAASGGAEISFLAGRLAAKAETRPRRSGCFGRRRSRTPRAPHRRRSWRSRELLLAQDRSSDAVSQLEHLILTYPESALVPQARRRLDQARGAVPKT